MKKNDLIIENEKLKNRIETQDKLLKEAIEANIGWQLNVQSAKMFIAVLMDLKGVKTIEVSRELLNDVQSKFDVAFEEVTNDEKIIGVKLVLKEKTNETEKISQ